ncbi:TSL-kinase interacting protein 1 isoform X2 [Cornus florida]|uniref:TSL-kinase interacting protein 1 isoform X2 n=1 Tax=Cornus florida TaxID=4283 RepID=UPI0028A1DDF3|nr:TSL-kinase interacting protein 1 isoform X2 [Cornus florida]
MQMEPQVSLDCEARLHPENILMRDGNDGETPSSQDHAVPQQPVKKQTRQWAAWTRQEEESFFTALRQVGKNFEKITCRVQSKNKDQVRHYYYRLVRRMNKLLGPELCLDAKNSKDTNAAMLRWWSLLEKYSCKASKLHLKPRRFKIFIENLEHQLLKDRKKNIRKRPSQGENCPPSAPTIISNQGKTHGHDSPAVKVVLVDSQNIQKVGPGKGSSLRRNVNLNVNHSNCKGDSSSVRAVRQRRKAAAYKRWEKAAIAGVSLVADAAEHLERTATDRELEHVQNPLVEDQLLPNGQKVLDPVGKDFPPMPTFSKNLFMENNTQTSVKLKLQLFPIDDGTRRALEQDDHNPHLELTLSSRKKISSVLEHLNRKWGNSSIASGELVIFPYCAQRKNLLGYQRWTLDSMLCAADVYALIGSPPVFRLRYGWFSHNELGSTTLQAPLASRSILEECIMHPSNTKEQIVDSLPVASPPIADQQPEKQMDAYKDKEVSVTENADVTSSTDLPGEMVECTDSDPNNKLLESSNCAPTITLHGRESGTRAITRRREIMDDARLHNNNAFSAVEWADSLTNISVGDLLLEVSHDMDSNCIDPTLPGSPQCLPQIPFSCDSFDAAIAAHIYRDQDKTGFQPALASDMSSIWDAEETCDAFSFQKITVFNKEIQSASQIAFLEANKEIARISSERSGGAVEEFLDVERPMDDNPAHGDPVDVDNSHGDPLDDDLAHVDLMDECQPGSHTFENSSKDLNGLTDIYWPDSLGPLDLDLPACRYHSEDLILSDSLSGMNRLIASSLDAFQNCSFFGLDKKEPASTVEARETVSFSDYKIGSEV